MNENDKNQLRRVEKRFDLCFQTCKKYGVKILIDSWLAFLGRGA